MCFNLGYLPQTDHTILTSSATTIPALQAALDVVCVGGVVSVMVRHIWLQLQ